MIKRIIHKLSETWNRVKLNYYAEMIDSFIDEECDECLKYKNKKDKLIKKG